MNKTLIEKPEKKISNKQQAFINAYCSNGFNATAAAIMAGYSQKTAQEQSSRLLSKVIIKQVIAARQSQNEAASELSAAELRSTLALILRNGSEQGKLRAAELYGRHIGFFAEDNSQQSGQAAALTAEQTAELKAIASRLTKPAIRLVPVNAAEQPAEGQANAG